jgi:hypothetical protein
MYLSTPGRGRQDLAAPSNPHTVSVPVKPERSGVASCFARDSERATDVGSPRFPRNGIGLAATPPGNSDGWRDCLRVRATLHTYSARNTLLLLAQAEERGINLTHVAGFKAWLRLDRCARRGETALKVFAPLPQGAASERERGDAGPGKPDKEEHAPPLRFRLASVFDTLSRDRWEEHRGSRAAGCLLAG